MSAQKHEPRIKEYEIRPKETSASLWHDDLTDRNMMHIVFKRCGLPPWPPCLPPRVILQSNVSGNIIVDKDKQIITYQMEVSFKFPKGKSG